MARLTQFLLICCVASFCVQFASARKSSSSKSGHNTHTQPDGRNENERYVPVDPPQGVTLTKTSRNELEFSWSFTQSYNGLRELKAVYFRRNIKIDPEDVGPHQLDSQDKISLDHHEKIALQFEQPSKNNQCPTLSSPNHNTKVETGNGNHECQFSFSLQDLMPSSIYWVAFSVVTEDGKSPTSDFVQVWTAPTPFSTVACFPEIIAGDSTQCLITSLDVDGNPATGIDLKTDFAIVANEGRISDVKAVSDFQVLFTYEWKKSSSHKNKNHNEDSQLLLSKNRKSNQNNEEIDQSDSIVVFLANSEPMISLVPVALTIRPRQFEMKSVPPKILSLVPLSSDSIFAEFNGPCCMVPPDRFSVCAQTNDQNPALGSRDKTNDGFIGCQMTDTLVGNWTLKHLLPASSYEIVVVSVFNPTPDSNGQFTFGQQSEPQTVTTYPSPPINVTVALGSDGTSLLVHWQLEHSGNAPPQQALVAAFPKDDPSKAGLSTIVSLPAPQGAELTGAEQDTIYEVVVSVSNIAGWSAPSLPIVMNI